MNSMLKMLAKKAKNRLKTAGEYSSSNKTNSIGLSASPSYMLVANIRKIEDDPLFSKIKRVVERSKEEIIINPISLIIDKKYYSSLDEMQKEKYILKISKKYNTIKDYLSSNNF